MKIYIVNVFVNEKGEYGNPVGIILDEKQQLNNKERLRIIKKLGFSECVFITDSLKGNVSIYNPQGEIDFSGYALLGTAWYFKKIGKPAKFLESKGGRTETWERDGLTWIRAKLAILPPWNFEQFKGRKEIENMLGEKTKAYKHTMIWSWIDETKGFIRARTFASDWGIPEDEANGSGSMLLASKLGRKLTILHGKGSVIFANSDKASFAAVGGYVKEDTS